MSGSQQPAQQLRRNLSGRHIQMIGLGGAIGTGLFLGSAGVIKAAGPAAILGYAFAGLIAFLMMRQLGEMLVDEPVSGSLSHFSGKYCGRFFGFLAGWNYAAMYLLVGMAELTALGKYVHYWFPDIPLWMSATGFFLLINILNTLNVRVFGEVEFAFSLVKVVAIVLMIGFGVYLLTTDSVPGASVNNLWAHGGFMPYGISGIVLALPFIMFAFGGLEMVGFAAGETENPRQTIPRAVNQVLFRIAVFYIGVLLVMLSLIPWNSLVDALNSGGDAYSASPFVKILSLIGSTHAADILNFVVLTAALSVYNGVVYCSTRQLHSLAQQGSAPTKLLKLNKHGIPVNAQFVTAIITVVAVGLNFLYPNGTLELLMALAVAITVINWVLTSLTHLKFKQARRAAQPQGFPAPFSPLSNYLCIASVLGILLTMAFIPAVQISVMILPVWLLGLYLAYRKIPGQRRHKDAQAQTP
ncbi:amino acid permease [Pseudomonas fluorescens]|uniref:Amino acid permease n=1 Tax=Pseudomonas fluorescens TaxID=294 RepID=A0A379IE51_PSEFL|nr:amino acid permease [Pseudomonas fluorescens]AIG01219.1 aromatic amino acid transporter [Pseudomonas fluorescens]SUD31021.1 amino acid permease [Pseudomonas fluorescens]